MDYVKASRLLKSLEGGDLISTGSPRLDQLPGGGVHMGLFYPFHGPGVEGAPLRG